MGLDGVDSDMWCCEQKILLNNFSAKWAFESCSVRWPIHLNCYLVESSIDQDILGLLYMYLE